VITTETYDEASAQAIRLKEYQDQDVSLSERDASFLLSQLSPKITVRRRVQDDQYVLNPNQFVGVVTLPSGRRLESHPKIPTRNLFYMLAVAFDLPSPFMDELADYGRLDELLEFVASYFTQRVESRLNQGLYRSYVEREDNLSMVRGRISFAEDVRRNYVLRHRTYCRYAEFSWDIPENQIIRQVVHLLGGWGLRRDLRLQLRRIDAALAEVTPVILPPSATDRFHYNRWNEDYRLLHRLCRLFLEGASVSEESGPFDFSTFLVDMEKLFERFITQMLFKQVGEPFVVDDQVPMYLGHKKKVRMFPDIVVSREGTPELIADCKYKRLEPSKFKNHDIYQMFAYCTASRVRRGLLIYPLHTARVQDEVGILNTETVVQQTTIDLGKDDIQALDQECDILAQDLVNWVETNVD